MDSHEAIELLKEGNDRFASRRPCPHLYSQDQLEAMANGQSPFAAVIACMDSRVSPDVVFDQPLGSLFASRVPANVASDSTKWMIDIAVGEFHVPLVVVMAHSNCVAVRQVVEGKDGPGGMLRYRVQSAFHDASSKPDDQPIYERTIDENARKTCRDLLQESRALADAVRSGNTIIVPARYDIETGKVVWL